MTIIELFILFFAVLLAAVLFLDRVISWFLEKAIKYWTKRKERKYSL